MAPIRRYLRITKYSVLEVRIYLHKPSDTSWLLANLDRIIALVRPKVLPKLREENELARKKSGKKKRGIKDVVSQDDLEVAIFLKETSARHSLLTKQKAFREKGRIRSNASKLTGWIGGTGVRDAIRIDDEVPAGLLREEDEDEDVVELKDIPEANGSQKRKSPTGDDEDDALFVSSSDEEFFATQRAKPTQSKRRKRGGEVESAGLVEAQQNDDKKKMMLDTSYDGFSIYGRILCLIVTRKGKRETAPAAPIGGSQMMEQWIGTQAAQEQGILDDDDV